MLKTTARWLHRFLVSALILTALTFAGVVLGLRYWVLPNIADYREHIATSISHAAGQRVTIREIGAGWDGLRPHLSMRGVEVHDSAGRPALHLEHIEGTLAWWALALGEIRLHSLELDRPNLALRRTDKGDIYVGGVWVNQPGSEKCIALVYEGHEAVRKIRDVLGPTDPSKAPPGSIRRELAIWQDLVDDHGFASGYASVQRFVKKLRGTRRPETHPVITTAPGEEVARIDGQYGAGLDAGGTLSDSLRARLRLAGLNPGEAAVVTVEAAGSAADEGAGLSPAPAAGRGSAVMSPRSRRTFAGTPRSR